MRTIKPLDTNSSSSSRRLPLEDHPGGRLSHTLIHWSTLVLNEHAPAIPLVLFNITPSATLHHTAVIKSTTEIIIAVQEAHTLLR